MYHIEITRNVAFQLFTFARCVSFCVLGTKQLIGPILLSWRYHKPIVRFPVLSHFFSKCGMCRVFAQQVTIIVHYSNKLTVHLHIVLPLEQRRWQNFHCCSKVTNSYLAFQEKCFQVVQKLERKCHSRSFRCCQNCSKWISLHFAKALWVMLCWTPLLNIWNQFGMRTLTLELRLSHICDTRY